MWDAPWHWVVLAIIVIALFGYKRLPDAARSLGRSMRIFKTEVKGMSEDDKKRAAAKNEKPKAIEAPSANGASTANSADAQVVEPQPVRAEADGGLAHTVAETAPRPRPRPTPNP